MLQTVYILIRIYPLDKVLALCLPDNVSSAKGITQQVEKERDSIAMLIDVLDSATWRFAWLNTCVPRSIVLCRLLRCSGVIATVKIGVQKEGDSQSVLRAHAWVEDSEGTIFDVPGVDTRSYVELENS